MDVRAILQNATLRRIHTGSRHGDLMQAIAALVPWRDDHYEWLKMYARIVTLAISPIFTADASVAGGMYLGMQKERTIRALFARRDSHELMCPTYTGGPVCISVEPALIMVTLAAHTITRDLVRDAAATVVQCSVRAFIARGEAQRRRHKRVKT